MTTQEIDTMLAGLLEQGVIDQNWLENPSKIAHPTDVQPHTARWLHWLTLIAFVAIAIVTVGLVVFVSGGAM